jgi:hypothetical protein
MELNFDKEMDALLRQTARQEMPAPAAEAHLDADELAAFSANALPVKARSRAMEHLVDCGNCRTILSNLVFFENQEEEKPAAVFAVATPPITAVTAAKESSLMERILGVFKFPTLAYGMAALVLLFTGAVGLMILRNNSGGVEMAQVSNKELSAATKAVAEQLQDTANEPLPALNTNMAANAAPMASAANNAMGGAFSVPVQTMPGGYAANSTSNVSSTLRKDTGPAELEEQPKLKPAPVVIDGISTEAAPAPPPPATGTRQEFRVTKPEQPLTDQVTRGQDNYRNNNVQNNILTPDGSDKDRRQRAVTGEAGANLSRDADRERDEKEKLDANDSKAGAPAKTVAPAKAESKKASNKKAKKNAAAAEASATPAATPAKTPEAKKTPQKPDDEERPPW